MLKLNNEILDVEKYPDGTINLHEVSIPLARANIIWQFENNEELVTLIFLVGHLRRNGISEIHLYMPYVPNARMDRVRTENDVFTLKYFAEIINNLNFTSVKVLDPHSSVCEALIDRIEIESPRRYIISVAMKLNRPIMFYPDEGAMKRYSDMADRPYTFGIKKRDWKTGKILGLDIAGEKDLIKGSNILIVDDICSKGGTAYHAAKALKDLGADKIYFYITHCENSIFDGKLLDSRYGDKYLIERIFTTNSIFTKEHERITVMNINHGQPDVIY